MKTIYIVLLFLFPTNLFGQSIFEKIFIDEDKIEIQRLDSINKKLSDSLSVMIEDIFWAIEYINSLEEELEREKKNIKTITKIETVFVPQIDTIRITQSGYDINTIYSIPFDITQRLDGGIYNITGLSKFRWNFDSNKPISPTTNITSFEMRLNVRTDLLEVREGYEVFTQPLTPNVIITENQNNILTEDDYIKKIPSKFGIGVIAGFGFTYKGMSPYAGIGISYNFYDMGKLIQKIRR